MSEGLIDERTSWCAYRWNCEFGEIQYHAHGPKRSFVVFEGSNAKADCEVFMKAVNGVME